MFTFYTILYYVLYYMITEPSQFSLVPTKVLPSFSIGMKDW